MKAPSPTSQTNSQHPEDLQPQDKEWDTSDPVWQLLGEANQPQADPFFARNIVRSVRQMELERPSLAARLSGIFSGPRLALGAISCAAIAAVVWQAMPSASTQPNAPSIAQPSAPVIIEEVEAEINYFEDLVMTETLSAAAEDPSIFTRDEVVAMLGL